MRTISTGTYLTRRFLLSNSILDSDDDAIVLKSTGMAPCEDVVIRACIAGSWANRRDKESYFSSLQKQYIIRCNGLSRQVN